MGISLNLFEESKNCMYYLILSVVAIHVIRVDSADLMTPTVI